MSGTLGPHGDPDLHHARAAAERAICNLLTAADLQGPVAEVARMLAEVAVDAAWCDLKRAHRPRLEDGR